LQKHRRLASLRHISDKIDIKKAVPDYVIRSFGRAFVHEPIVKAFFESGLDQKIFNSMNAVLFMVQDDAMLRRVMKPFFSAAYPVFWANKKHPH
jgi:hypothetical protein